MSVDPIPNDPWAAEAERAQRAPGFRRPDLGPVPKPSIYLLGVLAASRAVGLVLIAEAVARGIGALAGAGITPDTTRIILLLGLLGILLRAGGEWATSVVARRIATIVKRDLRSRLWRRIALGGTDQGGGDSGGGTAVLAADGLDDLDDYYVQTLPALIAAAVVPLIVGVRILGADWLSALIIVLTIPLVPLFMILIGKHTQQRTAETRQELEQRERSRIWPDPEAAKITPWGPADDPNVRRVMERFSKRQQPQQQSRFSQTSSYRLLHFPTARSTDFVFFRPSRLVRAPR